MSDDTIPARIDPVELGELAGAGPRMPRADHDAITAALPQSAAMRPDEGPVIPCPA
jgi:hypothetical protein